MRTTIPDPREQPPAPLPRAPALPGPATFVWATGIEDTFITDPWLATGRTLDEYELTHHYQLWREDLDRMADLGVSAARYGIPWYRIQPAPDRWDWSFPDQVLPALRDHGLEILLDLVHYGTPAWLHRAFLSPAYADRVAEYAAAVAGRYRGLIRCFTPLNEPRITAWYTGRVGLWPPYAYGWTGFARVMLSLCQGICQTAAALREVVPDAVLVHVDATDQYVSLDPSLADEVRLRQQVGFLALDLVSGRVDDRHPLWDWLCRRGFTEALAAWFRDHAAPLDVVGVNMYPMYSLKRLVRTRRGIRQQTPYAPPDVLKTLVAWYAGRYRRPVMITETAARGPIWRRARWMDESIGVVRDLRAAGVPIIG
ncbi:MAG: family 1 glycosylhydrolase, partial [Armatimonadetes bacterium]|nr:family 1 glycosylhydrolase [Armatimonadota bacterium]